MKINAAIDAEINLYITEIKLSINHRDQSTNWDECQRFFKIKIVYFYCRRAYLPPKPIRLTATIIIICSISRSIASHVRSSLKIYRP